MSLPCKTYVDVLARFDAAGKVTPVRMRRAASLKGGGLGIRYTVRIMGKETYLWRDEDCWFVERKD